MMMKPPTTLLRKTRDFVIGFVGWFVIVTLYWWSISLLDAWMGDLAVCCIFPPMPVNIGALILLSWRKRYSIASGVVSAFVFNWIMLLSVITSTGVAAVDAEVSRFSAFICVPFFLIETLF
jgi:hypothetical protein